MIITKKENHLVKPIKISPSYKFWLKEIKELVAGAKTKAAVSVNEYLVLMYWQIGQMIVAKQQEHLWGDAVIEQLSIDLQKSFPQMKGFSRSNLFNCKKIFLFYSNQKVQPAAGQIQKAKESNVVKVQPVAGQIRKAKTKALKLITQIPWTHNVIIVEKVNDIEEALFYLAETAGNNWSKNILLNQVAMGLYGRKGKALNNFPAVLSKKQSTLAAQTFKDPYFFDFLSFGKIVNERNLEEQLINHITKFLLELGKGFAFVGKQYHLEVGRKDYYIDLLFYHLHLRCYVVLELKTGEFKPEHAGQINFYLSAVDDIVADSKKDNPTIGIILCKEKDTVTAEYAVRGFTKPIGVSQYEFIKSVPKRIKSELPTIAELEKELKVFK